MPVKIGFTIVSSTGEDERYRATELNYHGPTVRGWRSAMNCNYPQEIIMQLSTIAVVHRIQILSHQYLIPQKIEIWISEGVDYDPSLSPGGTESFEYLGFITFSNNESTAFKSRELKSVTVPPTTARYIKLRLHTNHVNEKNVYNQIGIIAVNVLGDEVQEIDTGVEVNNNGNYFATQHSESTLISNPQYVSPYDDLAFEMYVDKDIARIMRVMEAKKYQAVLEERFEYASKLKIALEDLREAGETLGKYEQEKRQAINTEDYDKAKLKKLQIDQYREQVYTVLQIDKLLELEGPLEENDLNSGSLVNRSMRKQELAPPQIDIGKGGKVRVRTPSPNPEGIHIEREDKCDWNFMSSDRVNKTMNYYSQSPNPTQLIHSQSHTSFERYEDNSQLTSGEFFTNPHNSKFVDHLNTMQHSHTFSSQGFQTRMPLFNSHSWQFPKSAQESSDTYHSLPISMTLDGNAQLEFNNIKSIEFPPPQRKYSDGEIKFQSRCTQKTVDFDSPIAQSVEADFDTKNEVKSHSGEEERNEIRPKSPDDSNVLLSRTPAKDTVHRPNSLRGSLRRRNRSTGTLSMKNSYEAYEERMLPALRHYHANEIVRECQIGLVEPTRKSKLNEREKKQAALPITVFGLDLVEKFYSKHFADKEEGLKQLQEQLKRQVYSTEENPEEIKHPPNKVARATIFLLHRALRDKVYSVYSSAADTIRLFFSEYVPERVSSAEVARSVEKLLPELIAKSGDSTPRIHNMAAHTLLSMADCKEVRELHIIPVHLSRPLTSSVHPRLALSRLEMIEQLILNHGISTDKQSGLTCRTLAEFGSSGLHHPAEAVRKVSERILIQVYRVNPRLVRKQLPPDDDITRRNLLYRQLFQEFDFMDLQRKREMNEKTGQVSSITRTNDAQNKITQSNYENQGKKDLNGESQIAEKTKKEKIFPTYLPKRTVNQQTSPIKPFSLVDYCTIPKEGTQSGILRYNGKTKDIQARNSEKVKTISSAMGKNGCLSGEQNMNGHMEKQNGMLRIPEEKNEVENKTDSTEIEGMNTEKISEVEDVTLKFPNLIDSVRVAEERLSYAQKSIKNIKSHKYIFPTTYIGNSTTSQDSVNTSNSVNSFCSIVKKPEWTLNKNYSGIPIPRNGKNFGMLAPISSTKMTKSDTGKKGKSSNGKSEKVDEVAGTKGKENEPQEAMALTNSSMTESLYFGSELGQVPEEGKSAKEQGAGNSSSTSILTPPSEGDENAEGRRIKNKEPNTSYKMCIFCFASDNWVTEESLNKHYWNSCPMLTRCVYCQEVVEISGLILHRLDDCEYKYLFIKCDKCQEAVPKELITNHDCIVSENKNPRMRCTMCHSDIKNEDEWRDHLMGAKRCPNHPRNIAEEKAK